MITRTFASSSRPLVQRQSTGPPQKVVDAVPAGENHRDAARRGGTRTSTQDGTRQEPEPTEAPQPEIKAYSGRGDDVITFKRAVTQPMLVVTS